MMIELRQVPIFVPGLLHAVALSLSCRPEVALLCAAGDAPPSAKVQATMRLLGLRAAARESAGVDYDDGKRWIDGPSTLSRYNLCRAHS